MIFKLFSFAIFIFFDYLFIKLYFRIDTSEKEYLKKQQNILSEELEEPIKEIFNESLSLDLSKEKILESLNNEEALLSHMSRSKQIREINEIQKKNNRLISSLYNNKEDENEVSKNLIKSKNKNSFNINNSKNLNNNLNTDADANAMNDDIINSNIHKSRIHSATEKVCKTIYPKVASLFKTYERLDVKAYSIKLQVADADLLDLFDRSQRTKAATLAKVGDYEYYTPCQRIGSFMDFSAALRWHDLKNIEKHHIHSKNQLGFLQSKHNIITLVEKNFLKNNSQFFTDPNSLFHGFLIDEYKLDNYYKDLKDRNKTYDPIEFLPKSFFTYLHDPKYWSESFLKLVKISLLNYYKYFNSDKITLNDIEPFNEEIKKRILEKIEYKLFENRKDFIKNYFEEIRNDYYYILKEVIMQYILRSPYERKRLNIQYFLKATPPSSIIIANHGSFNRALYKDWVKNYARSTDYMEKNLFCYDIISTSVIDWTESFKHVNLLYLKNLKNLSFISADKPQAQNQNHNSISSNNHFPSITNNCNANINYNNKENLNENNNFNINLVIGNTISINKKRGCHVNNNQGTIHLQQFREIQNFYTMKNFFFLRDIYYRGIILILKKNKYFKKKTDEDGKWTFKGFIKKPKFQQFNNKHISVNLLKEKSNIKKKPRNTNVKNINNIDNSHSKINRLDINYKVAIINDNEESNLGNTNNNYNNNPISSFNSPLSSPRTKSFINNSRINQTDKSKMYLNNNENVNNYSIYERPVSPLEIYENELNGMEIFDKIEDFWATNQLEDFPDIRIKTSYYLFLANLKKRKMDLTEFIYDQYDDVSKLKINNSITSFVNLFFRNLIEKSLKELVDFILSFRLVDEIIYNVNKEFYINNPGYNIDNAAGAAKQHSKESANYFSGKTQINTQKDHISINTSNKNLIHFSHQGNVNIGNMANSNTIASKRDNFNLITINEIEKYEKSFKEEDVTFIHNQFPNISNKNMTSPNNNVNNNLNSISSSNIQNEAMINARKININSNTANNPNFLSINNIKEGSNNNTHKSIDTARSKETNFFNFANFWLFPHYDINQYINYKDNDIKLPIIKSFIVSDVLNPVIHISTKIDNIYNVVKLEFSYDQVSEIFIKICNDIINLFNNLYTTHFLDFKENVPSDVEKIQKAHWMRINEVFSDKLDTSYKDYYLNVSPNLIIDLEKLGDNLSSINTLNMGNYSAKKKNKDKNNIFNNSLNESANNNNDYNKKDNDIYNGSTNSNELLNYFALNIKNNMLKPAVITEDIFVNYLNLIAKTVKEHILEMEESLKLFEPIKDLINRSFADLVSHFAENFGTIPEYNKFTFFIDKIRIYQRYVHTIPDFVIIYKNFFL